MLAECCNRLQCGAVWRSGALHGVVSSWRRSSALYGAVQRWRYSWRPVRDIGAPGSMLIGPCMTGGKLLPE